jgi:hypothetical protein
MLPDESLEEPTMVRRLNDVQRVKELAECLRRVPRVAKAAVRRGTTVDAEAWQIATALADVEECAEKLFAEIIPRLIASSDGEAGDDALNDVGEEYRHILYHIMDTKVFEYVVPRE